MAKPRIVKDYDKLNADVQSKIKFIYPKGFSQHLVSFTNQHGEKKVGLPFETDEYYYLIRMSESRAVDIIDSDDDFDDEGNLKESARAEFGEKFKDMDFIGITMPTLTTSLGDDEEEHDPYADRDKEEGDSRR